MSKSGHMRLVVIEDSVMVDLTAEEVRKGLSEEYLFLCQSEHYDLQDHEKKLDPKEFTVYHYKHRPVG